MLAIHKMAMYLTTMTLFCMSLLGEIREVVLSWNPAICLDMCIYGLEKNLRELPFVASATFNARAGTAVLKWKKDMSFNYEPLLFATRSIGVTIRDVRIIVTGKISHDGDNYYLLSTGDGTRFLLLGPLIYEPGRYSVRFSLETHPVPPGLMQKFLEAEKNDAILLIEGPLFEFTNYAYLPSIITEKVALPKSDDE